MLGCISIDETYEDEISYSKTLNVKEISGKYSNTGFLPNGEKGSLLSSFLFPNFKDHLKVDTISVDVNEKEVILLGLSGTEELIRETYIENEDFTINDNQIEIKDNLECSGCGSPQAVHLGVKFNSYKLLFTIKGDVVLRKNEREAVVLFMLLPVVAMGKNDTIYKKIGN